MAPDIASELAAKGLQADGRNALQDVAQGDTLSAYHRQLLQSKIIGEIEGEDILDNRRALLLARFAMAGRLSKDELDEIKDLIPDPKSVTRKINRENYKLPLEHYATASGYEVRNIKKWRKIGAERSPPDLPPLDDPASMPSWWGRVMTQRCPARVLAWASSAQSATEPAAATTAPTDPAPSTASATPPPSGSSAPTEAELPEGVGYAATLARWQQAERVAHRFYEQALNKDPFDEGLFEQRRRAYERASEMIRKLEIGKEDILATDSEWGKWEDYEHECARALGVLNQSLRSIPVRLATKLALNGDTYQALVAAWQDELDRAFDHLAGNNYRTAYEAPAERDNLALDAA